MRSMVIVGAMVVVLGFCGLNAACAASAAEKSTAGQKETAIVDVGNKICPVTGAKVDGKTTYVYKGKRYNLCCPMCPAMFASDPEKYSAIADKEAGGK